MEATRIKRTALGLIGGAAIALGVLGGATGAAEGIDAPEPFDGAGPAVGAAEPALAKSAGLTPQGRTGYRKAGIGPTAEV